MGIHRSAWSLSEEIAQLAGRLARKPNVNAIEIQSEIVSPCHVRSFNEKSSAGNEIVIFGLVTALFLTCYKSLFVADSRRDRDRSLASGG